MDRPNIYNRTLQFIEDNLRTLVNKSPDEAFTQIERQDMSDMADKLAMIRIPINLNGKQV